MRLCCIGPCRLIYWLKLERWSLVPWLYNMLVSSERNTKGYIDPLQSPFISGVLEFLVDRRVTCLPIGFRVHQSPKYYVLAILIQKPVTTTCWEAYLDKWLIRKPSDYVWPAGAFLSFSTHQAYWLTQLIRLCSYIYITFLPIAK